MMQFCLKFLKTLYNQFKIYKLILFKGGGGRKSTIKTQMSLICICVFVHVSTQTIKLKKKTMVHDCLLMICKK